MNERIRLLADQANGPNPFFGTLKNQTTLLGDGAVEKFALLIVDQMLAITDAHTEVFQTDRDQALIEHITQSVKQHFGVEE